jgi:hypothetical protein
MQAQGSEARVVIAEELTFKSAPELVLEDCEDAWNEQVVANVTQDVDAVNFKEGTKSASFALLTAASTGIVGSEAIVIASLADYTHVVGWIKSDVALDANDFQLLLDNTANCASPLETLNLPAVAAGTWTRFKVALANPSTDLALISIGLKMAVDKGACTILLDGIKAIKDGMYVPFLSESMRLSRNFTASNVIRSSRNPNKPARGNQEVAGDINTELNPWMGRLFKHLLGSYTRADAGPYTHTFKIGSLPTGLQIEKQFTDILQYIRYNGCKINSHKGTIKAEGPLEGTFSFMGAKETVASPIQPHDPSPTDFGHNPFDGFEAVINQGGVALGVATEVTYEINNNLDGSVYVIGGAGERYSIPAGKVKVSGKLTALFESMTLYNLAVAHTETSLQIVLTKGTGAGSAGNEKLTYNFDEVVFRPQAPVIAGDKGIVAELEFEAYYDNDADASACWIELKNANALL